MESCIPSLIWETIACGLLHSDSGIRCGLNVGSTCRQLRKYISESTLVWKTIARMLGMGVGWFQAQLKLEKGPVITSLREYVLRSIKLWDKSLKLGPAKYRTWYHARKLQWEDFSVKWLTKPDYDLSNFSLKIKGPTSPQVRHHLPENYFLMAS